MEWKQRVINQLQTSKALLQRFRSWADKEQDRLQLDTEIKECDDCINWLVQESNSPEQKALANYNPPAWSPDKVGGKDA